MHISWPVHAHRWIGILIFNIALQILSARHRLESCIQSDTVKFRSLLVDTCPTFLQALVTIYVSIASFTCLSCLLLGFHCGHFFVKILQHKLHLPRPIMVDTDAVTHASHRQWPIPVALTVLHRYSRTFLRHHSATKL